MTAELKKIRQIKGTVLKNSKDKSVLVEVKYLKIHPIYKKRYFTNRRMVAHTDSEIKAGESVLIQECRPISRHKAWQVIETKS